MSRPAMRMLSSRWQHLQPLATATRTARLGCRCSSRYSQAGARSAATTINAPRSTEQASSDPYIKDEAINQEITRQDKLRRIRYASWSLFFSTIATGVVAYQILGEMDKENNKRSIQLESSSDVNAKFQGLPVHTIGAGDDKRIVAEGPQDIDLVETGTSSVPYFPKTIFLPTTSLGSAQPNTPSNPGNLRNDEEYTLVGLGIRTVSFLSIQVYVMGLYVRNSDLSVLQKRLIHYINPSASTLVPSEKEQLGAALSDPTKSTEIWDMLLAASTDIKSAWRISPTRNTDFAHLRDGWITGIKKGTQAAQAAVQARASGPVGTEYDSEEFGDAVKRFKDIFHGGGKAAKGSVVTLARDEKGGLNIYFEDPKAGGKQEKLGTAQDGRVSKLIWLGYLAGKNVSSEAARKGVAEGLLTLTARPVGSAETMVT
ncbi:chalcone-flavanone isomerase-domain-containing protein [Elsinoe ampelina]|uniref:Chalcone-flavanone isomerase-domain-containing protein n=1 Tax=Elsinoe ampelina TaxID=302913 RepID=A0A6A6GK44_9PEZI|nr:chalcone-flavanone isomerase-domain-containing protein [Elsinoe ampelina]